MKKICFWICFCMLLTLFFNPLKVQAEDGTVTGVKEFLSLREKKDTDSTELQKIPLGTTFYVVDTTIESGKGCSSGFYYAYYGGSYGYVCSKYVYIEGITELTYERPWTTPAKAIIGGAKYIASTYISRGQNTSYLKKFNVNPNGYYAMYTHQYMANLRAPASEASRSYSAYLESNYLLTLPLEFTIPVYLNMPEYTTLGNMQASTLIQDEITDQEFESLLDAQGFPESYKKRLRAIHTSHPSWVFKAMHVNDNFDTAVLNEKEISSIEISSGYCDSPERVTEKGWCIATTEAVAYYLDPRNFLIEKYLLQFEDLGYSANYTETIVQSILDGSFMEDLSILDNEKYASIFVRAGFEAQASSVYLASLARQEVGTNGSKATSGEQFTYNNVTYQGLYNYYNLGANSSASSPVLAGLVWASGGASSVIVKDPTITVNENDVLALLKATKNGSFINGYNANSTVENIIKDASGKYAVTVTNSSGSEITGTSNVGTGSKIKVAAGDSSYEYTIVIYGDLNGDGLINSADLLKMRQHLLETSKLEGVYAEAGNTNHDNTGINSADLLKMRQHLLETSYISQS